MRISQVPGADKRAPEEYYKKYARNWGGAFGGIGGRHLEAFGGHWGQSVGQSVGIVNDSRGWK